MASERGTSDPGGIEKLGVDLRRLRYFIAVCDHGGISKAASAIGMAQPALTRQIKLFEKEIGLPLITRSGRGAEPSRQGRFILERSREHLEGLDSVVRDVRLAFATAQDQISLGVCPTIAPLLLDDIKLHMRDAHPNVALSVIEAYSGDLQNLMSCGRLDIALTYRPSVATDVEYIELFSERLVLVFGYAPGLRPRRRSLSEIAKLKLILPSRIHELRRIIDRACKARNILLDPDLELDSLEAVKAILTKKPSRHVTVLPYHSVRGEIADRQLCCDDIDDPAMQRTIAVVMPRNARRPNLMEVLVARVRATAEQLNLKLDTLF